MNRVLCLLIAAGAFIAVPITMGASYTGSVIYAISNPFPQTQPSDNKNPNVGYVSPKQTVGDAVNSEAGGIDHAILWTAGGVTDLNPTNLIGIQNSQALGTNGIQQVGQGSGTGTGNLAHAMLWNGTAASAVDLNPTKFAGINSSTAYATNGDQQVGEGFGSGTTVLNALLWTGTAASAVNLNPTQLAGLSGSYASGTDGDKQVGSGLFDLSGNHALLWTGSATSAVDLNPTNIAGVVESSAFGVSGNQEVGEGIGNVTLMGTPRRAMLWTGTAASAVDLSPTNSFDSVAIATNGSEQVGWADAGLFTFGHAMLWTGTAASGINLQSLLPSGFDWYASEADSIDAFGNVYGFADEQIEVFNPPPMVPTFEDLTFAVEWSPVPEPTTASILLIASAPAIMRRSRRPTRADESQP